MKRKKTYCRSARHNTAGGNAVGGYVLLREHNALALSGCSRCVYEEGKITRKHLVVEIAFDSVLNLVVSLLDKGIKILDPYILFNDNAVSLFHKLNRALEILAVIYGITAASYHNINNIVIRELGIHRDRRHLTRNDREITGNPIVAVFAEYGNLFAAESQLVKVLSEACQIVIDLCKSLGFNLAVKIVESVLFFVSAGFSAVKHNVFAGIHIRKIGILNFFLHHIHLLIRQSQSILSYFQFKINIDFLLPQ